LASDHIELVLKAAAVRFYRNAQHGAIALGFEISPIPPGGPLADATALVMMVCAPVAWSRKNG